MRPCAHIRLVSGCIFGAMVAASIAQANPWPRGEGESFIALSMLDGAPSLWVDHGIGSDRTLALTAYMGRNRDRRVGLRLAQSFENILGMPRASLFALAELRKDAGRKGHALGLGVSIGRSVTTPLPGWSSAEVQVSALRGSLYSIAAAQFEIKANVTLGLRPVESVAFVSQIQAEHTRTGSSAYLAPSIVWDVRPAISLEAGLRHQVRGGNDRQVKLGTWLRF